ncbi:hypothetical protein BS78_01G115400 [Paspalum vaginatum]|nr:hypothetical protein BS78_01G115400 [Paspalum vaginatum]
MRSNSGGVNLSATTSRTSAMKVVWVLFLCLTQLGYCGYIQVDVTPEEFNHIMEHDHLDIFHTLYEIYTDVIPRMEVEGHRFLGVKDAEPYTVGGKQPFRGETDEDRIILAFADTDIYPVAFMSSQNIWHCFRGYEYMFPGCVVLNHAGGIGGERYSTLDGGYRMLTTIPLGNASSMEATGTIAHFRFGITPLPQFNDAWVRMMIMYCESFTDGTQ